MSFKIGVNITRYYSINFDLPRKKKRFIKFIIIHYTGMKKESDAINMLLKLSGKTHLVMTAVTIGIMTEEEAKFHTISVTSRVEFAKLTTSDCKEYCDTGEPFDKAGGYGIQGYGSAFIRKLNGSYSNVVGLPIHEVVQLLKELEIPYWSK